MHPAESPLKLRVDMSLQRVVWKSLALARLADTEYFEARLAASMDQVDYLVAISRRRAALAREVALDAARHGNLSHPMVWQRLAGLFEMWGEARSFLSRYSPTIWLEFDQLCSPVPQLGAPSVSVCLVPGYRTDEPLALPQLRRAPALVAEVLEQLVSPNTAALDAEIAHCFGVLPQGARWIHLSVMLGREPSAVKLYGTVPRGALHALLRDVGWRGELDAIAEALDKLYAPNLVGDELLVDLNLDDFRDRERASLGLAVGQQHVSRGPSLERTGVGVLDAWVASGLAAPERLAAAAAWAQGGLGGLHFFTDYKLVWKAGLGFTAKAYLGRHSLRAQQFARVPQQWGGLENVGEARNDR